MKIVITGCAGFIGAACAKYFLEQNWYVLGIDNLNDYYDVSLKHARLRQLEHPQFIFSQCDIADAINLNKVIDAFEPDIILHLAAQAGVRYSIENPNAYVQSNLVGFVNMLEIARHHQIAHFIYASSSSVYGNNEKLPYSIHDNVDYPISFYAATKKSNELMAYAYHHLYQFPCTGLRFFTVYGPWGRPDMAPFRFARLIMKGEPIPVYNHGDHSRDFTYIDDIVAGVYTIAKTIPQKKPAKIYNIGYGNPVNLLEFIEILEQNLGKTAIKRMLPKQPGDVDTTWADITELKRDYQYSPKIPLIEGIPKFAKWFKTQY